MSKHTYVLMVNKVNQKATEYTYGYGNTKDIKLLLSEMGFSIMADMTTLYAPKEMLSEDCYLFSDALRKALLLYLIKFSKALTIKSVTLNVDGEESRENFGKGIQPPIYSVINANLQRKMPPQFSCGVVFDYLLKTPRTKYDRRIAALFSLLCSKSKEYESERFTYLWTCFNGMYGWLSEHIARANGVDRYRRENMQIRGIQQFIGVGDETVEDADKTRIAGIVVSILKDTEVNDINREYIENSELGNRINAVLKKESGDSYNMTPYGYLLTQLSYYYRCKLVHGSKPVLLFAYAEDKELHGLQIINKLLEEFIDENLPLWFGEEYINNYIIPNTEVIRLRRN